MITYLNKTVDQLMSTELVTVRPMTIMTEVAQLFDSNNFHHLPVVTDEGICVGVISREDYRQLQNRFTKLDGDECDFENNKFLASLLAKEIMSKNPISIDQEIEISDVIPIFIANTARSAIVTKEGKCVGIITPIDLLTYMQQILRSYQKAIA